MISLKLDNIPIVGIVQPEEVCKRLKKIEPKTDTLHDILGCGKFTGTPSKERTKKLFDKLPEDLKEDVRALILARGSEQKLKEAME
jgi:tRNA isopentenyl-2-thiomethyl-A-37 hydroxylase MiaE